MPYGKGTYGSQVGRPSKQEDEENGTILAGSKRTSFVNDNKWWGKFSEGFKQVSNKEPQLLIRVSKDNAN